MGICHSKKLQQSQTQELKINIVYPSGKEECFIINPRDSLQRLLQQIFENPPITATDDKIIPGQQLLISKNNPKNILKFSEQYLEELQIITNETFMLKKTELDIGYPLYQNYCYLDEKY